MMKILKTIAICVAMVIAMSTVVLAEELPEEIKSILNDEGKLVVTDSNGGSKLDFLREYVGKYNTDTYYFSVYSASEDGTSCTIDLVDSNNGSLLATADVDVIYTEQYGEEFLSYLNDGKLLLPPSGKKDKGEVISGYMYRIGNEQHSFAASYCNDDYTECTLKMYDVKNPSIIIEQHVVDTIFSTEMSEEFDNRLNKDGKLVLNCAKPSNMMELYICFELLYDWEEGYSIDYIAEDLASCDFTINSYSLGEETHTVEIEYNYDSNTYSDFKNIMKNFPKDIEYFNVQDLELINYWMNKYENEDRDAFCDYSGELKSYLNNTNFNIHVSERAGSDPMLATERMGMAGFVSNGVIYYATEGLGVRGEHIIYVPNETGSTKEALLAAAQKRIDDYLGKKDIVKFSYGGTVYDCWLKSLQKEYEESRWWWEEENPNMTFEEWKSMAYDETSEDFKLEDFVGIKDINKNDNCFEAKIKSNGKEYTHYFIIRKDSSKIETPVVKTVDMNTNIQISTTSASVPLDTCIEVKEIKSGNELNKIKEVLKKELLKVDESVTFDLKLYSASLDKNITKIDDGVFQVRVPVPDILKNKDLSAYYIDDKNIVHEHRAKYDDNDKNFVIFETDHFSMYTLAEATEKADDTKKETTKDENTNTETTEQTVAPPTGDNTKEFMYILMLMSGVAVVTMSYIYSKKLKNS